MSETTPIDRLWERLADAIDAAGPDKELLFLCKLALLLGHEIGDADRVETLIAAALRDMD
jgi:hypothetical protein